MILEARFNPSPNPDDGDVGNLCEVPRPLARRSSSIGDEDRQIGPRRLGFEKGGALVDLGAFKALLDNKQTARTAAGLPDEGREGVYGAYFNTVLVEDLRGRPGVVGIVGEKLAPGIDSSVGNADRRRRGVLRPHGL